MLVPVGYNVPIIIPVIMINRKNGVVAGQTLIKRVFIAITSEVPNQYCGISPPKMCSR